MARTIPVSVIIPHYNRPERLRRALDSIAKQSCRPAEIIIVDDASRPENRDQLQQYSSEARIVYLDVNAGPAQARNAGMAAAQADFLAFLDDDDEWVPGKLEVQWNLLDEHAELAAVTSALTAIDEKRGVSWIIRHHSPEVMTLAAALEATPALIQSMLIRTPVMRSLGGFDRSFRLLEDHEFFIRLVAAGHQVRHLSEPLVRLHRGAEDHLTKQWWPFLRSQLQVVEKHSALYDSVFGHGGARLARSKYIRRAAISMGGVLGRLVFLLGCAVGLSGGPALKLLTTGRFTPVPYSDATGSVTD